MKRLITAVIISVGLALATLAPSTTALAATHHRAAAVVTHEPDMSVRTAAVFRAASTDRTLIADRAELGARHKYASILTHGAVVARAAYYIDRRRAREQARDRAEAAAAQVAQVQAQSVITAASYSGPYPGGAFGACVVARESGGNAQVMNASGHYGLYQFSAATWAAYGGNPADFGHASVAEQNQVFSNALAAGGESNWAPYDGC